MRVTRRIVLQATVLSVLLFGLAIGLTVSASGPFVEPDVTVLHTFTGDDGAGFFGWVAENLGDLDGDGVNDVITSAPFFDGNAGKIYVYSGADGTLLNAVTGDGLQVLGYSTSTAGDVNDDGVPDYVAGAPAASRAVVYSGADHSVLLELHGAGSDAFGASVAGAGDVNGDGHSDLIVGASNAGHTFPFAGRVSLYSGADGTLIWTRDGEREESYLGSSVGLVGDVNGDGVPDQVAGARGAGKHGRGEAYVFSGATGDVLYTMTPVGQPGVDQDGNPLPTFGLFFASGAGDVNNDGTPDVFVGDYNASLRGTSGTGRAYLFSGVDGSRLYLLNAEEKGDGFGPGRGTGDVNGDGYGDFIVGAYTSSAGASQGGKAYVYSGRDGSIVRTMTGSVDGNWLGVDALGVGDLNGDGATDYAITGNGVVRIVAGTPLQSSRR